jgi:TRAP-type mannitol/chloroaromatic compound transport system substrate-binding protein
MDRRSLIKTCRHCWRLGRRRSPSGSRASHIALAHCFELPQITRHIVRRVRRVCQKVGELSGGKFTITTHAAGELMPAFGVLDGVSNGTVEMADTAPYYFFGKDPTPTLWIAPFLRPKQPSNDCLDVRRQRLEAVP